MYFCLIFGKIFKYFSLFLRRGGGGGGGGFLLKEYYVFNFNVLKIC